MAKKYKWSFIAIVSLGFIVAPFTFAFASTADLVSKYSTSKKTGEKVSILIVPGHDDEYSGTEYRGTREADLNLYLSKKLSEYLENDPRLTVMVARTEKGYMPQLDAYFKEHRAEILQFGRDHRTTTSEQVSSGTLKSVASVPHNAVNQDVAVRLYGINKWANDNNIDLVLHIHMNDTPKRTKNNPGPYQGITVYIPESQYENAAVSKDFGKAIFDSLSPIYQKSTMPEESKGLVEDQTLIAVGASNTLTRAGSALVEYGYIYEPQFLNSDIARAVLNDLAFQTFLGIHAFFGDKTAYAGMYTTPLLPHTWAKAIPFGTLYNLDILSLQAALRNKGFFPLKDRDPSDCRMTGHFNPCTAAALKAFQKKYGIGQTGTLGPMTRKVLNQLFGG